MRITDQALRNCLNAQERLLWKARARARNENSPGGRTGVGVVAPAEDTLVGAGQRGRCLHAAVALDAIEGVLVAAAAPAQHALRPPAELHPTMRPCHKSMEPSVLMKQHHDGPNATAHARYQSTQRPDV